MPSTNSPNKGYELQATGENAGTWGVILNSNALSIIDLNFGGRLAKSVAGSSNVTITTAEARNFKHTLTGLLTGNIDYIVPNGGSSYIIYNNTTGAFTVTVKPDGGTGIVVPQGKTMLLFANPTTGAMEQVLDAIGGLVLTGTISPSADDGAALGTGALGWSDLFLAIGGIISWGNGDVTITHSTNALAFAGASSGYSFDANVSVAGTAITVTMADDGAGGGPLLDLNRNSASPAANDTIGNVRYIGRDSAGNSHVYAGTLASIVNPTNGAEEGALGFTISIAGSNGVRMAMIATALRPETNDGLALGVSGTAWADLFLASGGVINWAAGDVTITHSANALTFAGADGGFLFSSPLRSSSSFFGLGSPTTATIASGVITATSSYVQIDTEGGAATDDLDTINGGVTGDVLVLYSTSNVRDPTIKDGTGNLRLAGDFVMSHTDDRIILLKQGSIWFEISRSDNA